MLNGIILINKEKGYTSHDVVSRLRGILKMKKIGHTGTLDPDATGVLICLLGNATKAAELFKADTKEYRCKIRFGITTDTEDISGNVLSTCDMHPDDNTIKTAILSFLGKSKQIPPMYSALKVNGKKLYEYAREGITIEREARDINIEKIDIHSICFPNADFTVKCSTGTYIRTLCKDIGEKLKTGACMEELCRTVIGDFMINDAYTLSEVENMVKNNNIENAVLSLDKMFEIYDKATVNINGEKIALNGNKLVLDDFNDDKFTTEKIRVYVGDRFIGLYEKERKGLYKPFKMFLG